MPDTAVRSIAVSVRADSVLKDFATRPNLWQTLHPDFEGTVFEIAVSTFSKKLVGDDILLDLACAIVDLGDAGVAIVPLDVVV